LLMLQRRFCKLRSKHKQESGLLKNIIFNALKPGYFKTMLLKVVKRFEKNTSMEARRWALKNSKKTISDFCCSLDKDLWDESQRVCESLSREAAQILSKIPFNLGGGGAHPLLYFLVRRLKPKVIIETGVAAGWSSAAILSAIEKNSFGKLYSSDFPYFRIDEPEKYIGVLVKDSLKVNWQVDVRGDAVAVPYFQELIGADKIDFIHYDSDKSYSGREFVLDRLILQVSDTATLLVDDIQDNFQFRDFVEKKNLDYDVFEFEGKFIGLVSDIGLKLKRTTIE